MALDFPNNPTTGQSFTANGNTWTYDGSKWNSSNLDTKANLSGASFTGDIVSSGKITGTTPNNGGSSGGLVSRAPAGGTQTSAFVQFVNNANTAQWGAIAADNAGQMNYFGGNHIFDNMIIGKSNTGGSLAASNDTGGLSIRGGSGNAASMSFHRPGIYAINMGLDTDNAFKIGGWSQGGTPYLQINTSGQVQQPYQSAIRLDGNSAAWYSESGAVTRMSVAENRGGFSWNATNGRLTVPVAGYYHMTFTTYQGGGTTLRRHFRRNGTSFAMQHVYVPADTQVTTVATGYFAANDYIELWRETAVNAYMGSIHTYMMVHYLG